MSKKGRLLICAGILLLASALCLAAYNIGEARRAAASSEIILQAMETFVPAPTEREPETAAPTPTAAEPLPTYMSEPETQMPEVEIDGVAYIGVLNIDPLGLELPVISRWSDSNLKIAPCRYEGSAYLNDLVIAAHNYASHFGNLKKLSPGDAVSFTDMDGNVFHYTVTTVETLSSTAIKEMATSGHDLTLFTCTLGGANRVAVRCDEEE